MKSKLDRFVEQNPEVLFYSAAVDQHDSQKSRVCPY